MGGSLFRITAFSADPKGGNPAGVWVGDEIPDASTMHAIAADVGFSETAFVAPRVGLARVVRYFSPEVEIPFCGHATIAAGAVLGQGSGEGTYRLTTTAGEVPVQVRRQGDLWSAALTSVPPTHESVDDGVLAEALECLRWWMSELDERVPAARIYAGAWHLVIAVKERARLDRLQYDFPRLKALMLREGLATLQLVWREGDTLFHARNPFPIGGVVEDPATGAAAAALGGYLRDAGLLPAPASIEIIQGVAMGRPSFLGVDIPRSGGIVVSGYAVSMD